MAGFEVIVRPVVFPNIRPAPARALAPEDDPEQGIAVLSGSSGKFIDLSRTDSGSWTKSIKHETKREVAPKRIYQVEEGGNSVTKTTTKTINKDNFVDVEELRKLWERDAHEDSKTVFQDSETFERPKPDNVEPLGENIIYNQPDTPWGTNLSPRYGEVDDDRLPNVG